MSTIRNQELMTKYPVVEGLAADQKHDGVENNLTPEEKSLVSKKESVGL